MTGHRDAEDYYRDFEADHRDPQLVAMLAQTQALIDLRLAIEAMNGRQKFQR